MDWIVILVLFAAGMLNFFLLGFRLGQAKGWTDAIAFANKALRERMEQVRQRESVIELKDKDRLRDECKFDA